LAICERTRAPPAASVGREQDPAVHAPDRRRDQAQGQLIPSSLGRRADVRPDAPLPMPHPPVRADSARP
jgi:hypothetical protein